MTEQQFLRQIKRLLHCKADKKREILRQLESDIASAKEGGKSWEEIRQEWGTPEQFVSDFNEDGRGIQKGKRILIGSVAVLVLFACVAVGVWLAHLHEKNGEQQLAKNVETQKIEKIPDVVREAITDFSDDAYEKFIARCDAKMQAAFSKKNWEDAQKIASSQMIEKAENEKLLSVTQTTQAGWDLKVYQVAVDYGKRQIVYTISLDTENLIAGFYFK